MSSITQLSLSKLTFSPQEQANEIVGLSLGLFLPPAIAYFPQRAETDPKKLEDQFKTVEGPVYFNKGL